MKRHVIEIVREIAPPPPPCFETREQWVQYLGSAAHCQRLDHKEISPVQVVNGQMVFSSEFDFCEDCVDPERHVKQGTCKPDWLLKGGRK